MKRRRRKRKWYSTSISRFNVLISHKYTLFLSVDGNFRLQRKNKKGDPDDVALNKGRAYFVKSEEFDEYLRIVQPSDDVRQLFISTQTLLTVAQKGTCAHLRAARMQNVVRFKNAVISGVVGVQCARHSFYMPCGIVDLKKGEAQVHSLFYKRKCLTTLRYANTDYAIAHSLAEAKDQRWIMISYDIWCQYSVNIQKRFEKWLPGASILLPRIRGAIPKMHIKNHIASCQQLWAFNYLRYSGETWGENIEGSWAEQNQAAGSTKEQNDGHRHDTLDDVFGFWNWTKLHQMCESLHFSRERTYSVG